MEDLHTWVLVVMCTFLRKYHAKAYFASFPAYFDSLSGIFVRVANVSVRSEGFRTQDIVYPSEHDVHSSNVLYTSASPPLYHLVPPHPKYLHWAINLV